MKFPKFSSDFKRYFSNTSWLLLEKIIRISVTLVVGIYVARYLGPSRYGLLNYAISFVMLFSPIATLGLDHIVVRKLVKDETKRDELLGVAFTLKLFGALLLFGILAVAINFAANDSFTNLLIFIIATSIIFQSFNAIDFYFRAKVLSKYAAYARTTSMFTAAIIKLILIYLEKELIYFAIVLAVESIILALGLITVYKKQKLKVFSWKFDLGLTRNLLKDSWPLIFSGIAISVYMRIDQIMIKNFIDNAGVGNYAVAVKLSEAWYFIPTIITISLFPAIVEAKERSEELYLARLQRLYTLMTWLALIIAIPTTLLADDIIQILFGLQYQAAANVLRIYIWAGIFVFLGTANHKYLVAENYTRIFLLGTSTGMIVNVGLNLVLIPTYGITGAALATIISYFIPLLYIALIPKTRKQAILMLKSVNLFYIFGERTKED